VGEWHYRLLTVHSARFFTSKAVSELEHVSQMRNITPFEVEVAVMWKKFHRKLFDLAGDTGCGWLVVFHCLSALV